MLEKYRFLFLTPHWYSRTNLATVTVPSFPVSGTYQNLRNLSGANSDAWHRGAFWKPLVIVHWRVLLGRIGGKLFVQ